MIFAKIRLISAVLVGLGAAVTGIGVGVGVVGGAPQSAQQQPTPDRERDLIVRSATNLNRIGKAITAYLEANNNNFPAAAISDSDGTPLLSWRVAILPYLGESEMALYKQFNLSEPWDNTNNKALLAKIPKVYAPVVAKDGEQGKNVTHYLGFVGGGAIFRLDQAVNVRSVFDGTSNTLMIAEAVAGVPWTKPEDLTFTGQNLLPQLGGQFKEGFVGLTADGGTGLFKKSLNSNLLVQMITYGGNEFMDLYRASEVIRVP